MIPFIGASSSLQMFSASTLFSVYASLTALFTLIQQFYYQFVPQQVRNYISIRIEEWFTKSNPSTTLFTLVIEQFEDGDYDSLNQVYKACEAYLASKLKATSSRLKVSRLTKKDNVSFKLAQGEKYYEEFKGLKLQWSFIDDNARNYKGAPDVDNSRSHGARFANKYFELCFDPDHKDQVFDSYLPHILKAYDEISEWKKDLLLHSLDSGFGKPVCWRSVKFKHPFTFEALAMEPEAKRAVTDDLDRFINRREFYRRVGRAWKRGYLLYGPPGTGKSSLIAAMANYLKFDIFDLQLSSVPNDSALRRLLLSTTNKSILVIEDIDCSLGLADRQLQMAEGKDGHANSSDTGSQISLSGLLNFIDGLWSSCGDERIFIFTTNHKDKLDPALLRPGRMDMHIHMSYLTKSSFRVLASNYLNLEGDEHHLYGEIGQLLASTNVTPAHVAEELIRNDNADIALSGLVNMLREMKSKLAQKSLRARWGFEEDVTAQTDSGEDVITDEFSSD
ncbi:AAA-ATPase At3g50940-like [Silene latifolia]|uniref:AAA-ATPase At3g50940-like n=1 Tax=Silene latifolia TaxID=37657 RepID=UPI003D76E9AF